MLDLKRLGTSATVGAKAQFRLQGTGIADRHARIFRGSDRQVWIEPLEGEVWIERGRLRELVSRPQRLVHGDVIVIGDRFVNYSNAANAPKGNKKVRPTWSR